MSELPERLPCPFCGSTETKIMRNAQDGSVLCSNCSAMGPIAPNPTTAMIEAWNRRTPPITTVSTDPNGGNAIIFTNAIGLPFSGTEEA